MNLETISVSGAESPSTPAVMWTDREYEANILFLEELYSDCDKKEISEMYKSVRKDIEGAAKIRTYAGIFVRRRVEDLLEKKYGKPQPRSVKCVNP